VKQAGVFSSQVEHLATRKIRRKSEYFQAKWNTWRLGKYDQKSSGMVPVNPYERETIPAMRYATLSNFLSAAILGSVLDRLSPGESRQ
jgi:hypothetical protein